MAPLHVTADAAARLLESGDADFPPELRSIPQGPAQLHLSGVVPPPPRVALVGARQADEAGMRLARVMGEELAAAGICVVSGGAAGIDTAALSGNLAAGGRPVAVLGTGLDQAYPVANRSLFQQIGHQGALLSEYPAGTAGLPANFAKRNRIVSGLSEAVVVIQAAEKSGSLITARYAVQQGKTLMAVPGPAGSRLAAGCHRLLRQGALLVETARDVMEAMQLAPQRPVPVQPTRQVALPLEQLNKEESLLVSALREGPCAIDALCEQSGLHVGKVASLMMQLELKGLVEQRPGMVYQLGSNGGH